ncbi:MAG: DNA polymerase IV [Deltaproteobacteria bacterium]|nr:DNA polymerase IV [Deltaproteobacteria bacterium]
MNRHIIHIHIPAFSIALARVLQPGLRNRPIAVAQPLSERALILSVSQEARRDGIFKGMPLCRAVKLNPRLTVLPPNYGLIQKACQALDKIAASYTPIWEPFRPGHIYLDITGTERLWGKAKDTAYRLREEIRNKLCLAGTVGLAGNKMVSSIASRITPTASALLDVGHGGEASFIAPLKVNVLPGIGPFRQRLLLEELNIARIRELAELDMNSLKMIFGKRAHLIHQRATGIDPTPVYPPLDSPLVTEEITLSQDENDDRILLKTLYTLVEKCSGRLRDMGLFPGKAGLAIKYSDETEVKQQIKLSKLSYWDFDLYEPLNLIFLKAFTRRVRLRFMRIWFEEFSRANVQLSLFTPPTGHTDKRATLMGALDQIREHYGEGMIRYGRTVPNYCRKG